jgi:hypothetical protein
MNRYAWFVFASLLTAGLTTVGCGQGAADVKADSIAGVVTGPKGPEAGVWVIAETTDLPTKFAKIVVTDDQGRYLIPGLPQATYQVWVRGYGLVDSQKVDSTPGKRVDHTAVVAPSPQEAAKYYPASYWYSLVQVPAKSEFPMKPTPAPPYKVIADDVENSSAQEGVPNQETVALQTRQMTSQEQWIDTMKQGCQLCHQMGDLLTRDIKHLSGHRFKSTEEAWASRIHFGQAGYRQMPNTLSRFVDQERAIKMFADWTDRIAAGEVPPAPPRPEGVERNLVVTMWDWGKPSGHPHDEIATDRRKPTLNANGKVFAADYNDDTIVWVDPKTNQVGEILTPTLVDRRTMRTTWPQTMTLPSPFYGTTMAMGSGVTGPHNPMMDHLGRVWVTANVRPGDAQPAFCTDPSNPFAKHFPLKAAGKHVVIHDQKTGQTTAVDTCFSTHHLQLAEDADNTMYFSAPGGQQVGWINSRVLAETGDSQKAQGWCPAYVDSNGDGKIDPAVDKRIPLNGYGIVVNPKDSSVWLASTGPTPGKIVRMTIGANPPATCMAEMYEPPYNPTSASGPSGYAPRGIDVDRNGVIWTALSGSGQIASFDRAKCKVTSGPEATGQHCREGWTLYTQPGPKMKGVENDSSASFSYYNWVDQFNTSGLGENIPIAASTGSDSLEAYIPSTGKWVVMRVPYPMGFYTRGLDGRIDDPNGGWNGRGLWAVYAPDLMWHTEGGPGTLSKAVKLQFRPDPLAE